VLFGYVSEARSGNFLLQSSKDEFRDFQSADELVAKNVYSARADEMNSMQTVDSMSLEGAVNGKWRAANNVPCYSQFYDTMDELGQQSYYP